MCWFDDSISNREVNLQMIKSPNYQIQFPAVSGGKIKEYE
jgi:hypothetical protein